MRCSWDQGLINGVLWMNSHRPRRLVRLVVRNLTALASHVEASGNLLAAEHSVSGDLCNDHGDAPNQRTEVRTGTTVDRV
jgi:hypothetical protein